MVLIKYTVVNYEVVLSDSTIVNANATTHIDLFWALKGGGDQFGEVCLSNAGFWAKVSRYCHQIHFEDLSHRQGDSSKSFDTSMHDIG